MKKITTCLIISLTVLLLVTCKKDFLDKKPDKALLVPTTLDDFRALLDNNKVFNLSPGLAGIADGDTYTTEAGWKAFNTDGERNSYIWAADIFGNATNADWNTPFQQVFYANIVLDGLRDLNSSKDSPAERNTVEGTAFFHRGYAFFNLVQLFADPYQAGTAAVKEGIPIRLSSDVTQKVSRKNLQESYDQLIADLKRARLLLPEHTTYLTRPDVASAYALLARVYLSMGNYNQAALYADSCLQLHPGLIDYNSLSTTATRPFPAALSAGNAEMIFYSAPIPYSYSISAAVSMSDTLLYRSYAANDLRKVIFFRIQPDGSYRFKGNYAGSLYFFAGPASDELYLIRAECRARAGNTTGAMADLNTLLSKRWKRGTFQPFVAGDAESALRMIITERRKELTGRTLRWYDLRRLNLDPRFAITLTRSINGQTYTLEPGSKRYTYPIAQDELKFNNWKQNER